MEFDRSTSITLFKFRKEISKCIGEVEESWREAGIGVWSMENGEWRHGANGED